MNFVFDNNLSARLARALNELIQPEHAVTHLSERFASNVDDERWLQDLEDDWIVLTIAKGDNDLRLRKIWKSTGRTVVLLKPGWADMPSWRQAHKLTRCFPDIITKASQARPASCFLVSPNGRIES